MTSVRKKNFQIWFYINRCDVFLNKIKLRVTSCSVRIYIYSNWNPSLQFTKGYFLIMPKAERLSKEQLAEKRSFEGNCEILRTIFQPRALSSDIPASRKWVYLFYNPPINVSRRAHFDWKGKKNSYRYVHGFCKTIESVKLSLSQKCNYC